MPDNTDIQDQEQQVAEEDWATLLSESQTKVAQYHEELLRAKAEVENIRRRAQEDVAKARKFGTESFAESLIPVKDSLEAALSLTDQRSEKHTSELQSLMRISYAVFCLQKKNKASALT